MLRLVLFGISITAAVACHAASISYTISDCTDPAHPREIIRGTKIYSPVDFRVERHGNGNGSFGSESLELIDGYRVGASIYREAQIDGFGLWVEHGSHSFSWEWFNRSDGDVFKKLQDGGAVRVTYREVQGLKELESVTFESDISLRMLQRETGKITHRILVKKGSVLEFPR